MTKYKFSIGTIVEVDAKNLEEAEELAFEKFEQMNSIEIVQI